MREQCSQQEMLNSEENTEAILTASDSMTSFDSDSTEVGDTALDADLTSPSEGYKSGGDDTVSTVSASSDSHSSGKSRLTARPPTLKDFTNSLYMDSSMSSMWISTQSLASTTTNQMSASTMSVKSAALEQRVRKLCQSTTELDEKLRLARLEGRFTFPS